MTENTPTNGNGSGNSPHPFSPKRVQFGLIVAAVGFLIFLIGLKPQFLGLDRSPVLGFMQIGVMLFGLSFISLGGYQAMRGLWGRRKPSIAAEMGARLVSTGLVIAIFSGLADVFGLGSHTFPKMVPYFGEWQARGVQAAMGMIAFGLLLMIPFTRGGLFQSHIEQKPPPKKAKQNKRA